MRVFVTGVCGQLGHDVMKELKNRGHVAIGSDLTGEIPLDITQKEEVFRVLREQKPDAVIHCAAWTAVDAAEDCADKVRAINAGGTEHIAMACQELDCKMLYISTD